MNIMDRLNGGHALLDLTKYNLNSPSTAIEQATEITEKEYNELTLYIKNAYEHNKPLFVRANIAYGVKINQTLPLDINGNDYAFTVINRPDVNVIVITNIDDKYYIYTGSDVL